MDDQHSVPKTRSRRARQPEPDYSAYYSRQEQPEDTAQPAFAPPPKMDRFLHQGEKADAAAAPGNIYRPLEATWSEEERPAPALQNGEAYQVQEIAESPRRRRKRRRTAGTVALLLALLAAAVWMIYSPVSNWILPGPMMLRRPLPLPMPHAMPSAASAVRFRWIYML